MPRRSKRRSHAARRETGRATRGIGEEAPPVWCGVQLRLVRRGAPLPGVLRVDRSAESICCLLITSHSLHTRTERRLGEVRSRPSIIVVVSRCPCSCKGSVFTRTQLLGTETELSVVSLTIIHELTLEPFRRLIFLSFAVFIFFDAVLVAVQRAISAGFVEKVQRFCVW